MAPKIKITASVLAEYLILKSQKENNPITNKKLQKLLYYIQAWSLALRDEKIFDDKIEAWIHGPAIREVYLEYKDFGADPIKKEIDAKKINDLVDADTKKLIESVWKVYAKYDGLYLEMLTHSENPWQKARQGLEAHEISTNEISVDDMRSFYKSKVVQS